MSQSSRLQETLANIDVFARDLHNSLLSRNLSQIVDVIFVSDHGMGDTSEVEWIYLDGDDILGMFIPLPMKLCLFSFHDELRAG
jgi:predicted AlkP superfamily pyrophosphatase or phosphodiesterase